MVLLECRGCKVQSQAAHTDLFSVLFFITVYGVCHTVGNVEGYLDVLSKEPESLFEDYIRQVRRALLNKTLVHVDAINQRSLPRSTRIVCAEPLFIVGWSNGYFKRAASFC